MSPAVMAGLVGLHLETVDLSRFNVGQHHDDFSSFYVSGVAADADGVQLHVTLSRRT